MEINVENREQIIALLREGICPICGKGAFKVPLQHISLKHGINKHELKTALGVGVTNNSLYDSNFRAEKVNYAKKNSVISHFKGKKPLKPRITEETKKAISNAAKERNPKGEISPQINQMREKNIKAIIGINPETGEQKEYESVTQAAKDNNIGVGRISDCLRGRRQVAAGYLWRYKND